MDIYKDIIITGNSCTLVTEKLMLFSTNLVLSLNQDAETFLTTMEKSTEL